MFNTQRHSETNSIRNIEVENVNSHMNARNESLFPTRESNFDSGRYQKNSKKKFNKGLKMLSVVVKDIVIEKKTTTYKEVAEIILKDSIKYDKINVNSKQEIAKEE